MLNPKLDFSFNYDRYYYMNFFFFSIILSLCVQINAMNLLNDQLKDSEKFFKNWEYISDQVMGGVSTGKAEIKKEGDNFFLRLSGNVSTKNNGGFIQVRSDVDDLADNFKGLRLKVKGEASSYFIHIRTNFLFLPWQFYSGEFFVDSEWKEIELLFKDFKKSNFYQPSSFNSSEIESIGFVAFGKDFNARLDIMEAELF